MEQETSNQKIVNLVKQSASYKLLITKELAEKIKYVCNRIWKDEWSGTLFYKPEGKFEDGSLVIKCVDMYIMDIGNSVYTEFDMSPDVISYMTENTELLDCQLGLIHSHNQMSTFFSGTDIATLKEEGMDRNHFVSLIVNNAGTYTAAITRKVNYKRIINENIYYNSFEDKQIKDVKSYEVENEELQYFNLDIEFENTDSYVNLDSRLEEIRKSKEHKSTNTTIINQPTLFDNVVKESIDAKFENVDETKIKVNKEGIKSLVLQILTGSIIIPRESKIDIDKWVKGMESLYDKRFGKGDIGMKLFHAWAESYLEYLCWFSNDFNIIEEEIDDDWAATIVAYNIIKELEKLPKNKYIDTYIDILTGYNYIN